MAPMKNKERREKREERREKRVLSTHVLKTTTYLILSSLFFISCNDDSSMQRQQSDLSQSESDMKENTEVTNMINEFLKEEMDDPANSDPSSSDTLPKFQAFGSGDLIDGFVDSQTNDLEKDIESEENINIESAVRRNFQNLTCIKDFPYFSNRDFLASYFTYFRHSRATYSGYFVAQNVGDLKKCRSKYAYVAIYVSYGDKKNKDVNQAGYSRLYLGKEKREMEKERELITIYNDRNRLKLRHSSLRITGTLEKMLQQAVKRADPSTITMQFVIPKDKTFKTMSVINLNNQAVRTFARFAHYNVFDRTYSGSVPQKTGSKHIFRYYDNSTHQVSTTTLSQKSPSTFWTIHSTLMHHVQHAHRAAFQRRGKYDYLIMKRFFRVLVEALNANAHS
ncbi:MAG: hypothetical protein OXC44_08440 [Proteobacteria bacterium]|nr:hypothetical protein [Pseudomonadota bacterium]